MKRKKLYLIIQAMLCAGLALSLSVAAVRLLLDGLARRAENPLASVFTPEGVAAALSAIRPLFFVTLGWAAAGLLLGIRPEKPGAPRPSSAIRPAMPPAGGALRERKRAALQGSLLGAALLLILLGIFNGSALDVLYKAINICSECIGLG